VRELRQGFLEARKASEMRFLWPDRCVVRFEQFPIPDEGTLARDLVVASDLSATIALQDATQCEHVLTDLFDTMISHGADPATIRRAAFILSVGVQSALREAGSALTEQDLSPLPDLFVIVDTAPTVSELVRQLVDALGIVRGFLDRTRSQQRADEQLLRALEFIHAHYTEPISLDDVAADLHMHPSRFSVWFKKAKGVNYIDYLTRYRIEIAKQLLRSADIRIRDVAEQVGFQDPRYFGQVFKKLVGITPGRYQQQHGRFDHV
jgi:two-component system response regulator YesN